MPLQSMTGFSRQEGTSGRYRWAWELRSVNGKGVDLRLRLPQGFDRMEAELRGLLANQFSRGNLQITLSVQIQEERVEAVINRAALEAILGLAAELDGLIDPAPVNINTLLGMRGIVELKDVAEGPDEVLVLDRSVMEGLITAIGQMVEMREIEGSKLFDILAGQISTIERLVALIESDPSRTPREISNRLTAQLDALLENAVGLDRDRLHAEVALIATKADLREEIDRLKAHVSAARDLLANGGPVGRKLDFLAQEFNRESNTICSKSSSVAVTSAGIDLKVVIDQFREQVQNLE